MHTFKTIKLEPNTTLYDLDIQEGWVTVKSLQNKLKYLKDLNAPTQIIKKTEKLICSMTKKLNDRTYKPQYTMKDNLNKYEVLDIPIKNLVEEYNSNNKLVSRVINNSIKIKYDTMYCPIISKI